MDDLTATPRVNLAMMQQYINQRVLLTGKVENASATSVTIVAADGGKVSVIPKPGDVLFDEPYAEVCGTVTSSNTLTEESHVNLGDKYDMESYGKLLELANGEMKGMFTS